MPNMSEDYEELAAVNSELRFITLELMKIAAKQGKSFNVILQEFRRNAFVTKKALSQARYGPRRKA